MKLLASTRECEQHKRRSVCAVAPAPLLFAFSKAYRPRRNKTLLRGSNKKRLIPVSPQLLRLATQIEISLVANLDIIVSTKRLKAKALIRLVYAFVVRKPPKTGFLMSRPILCQPATWNISIFKPVSVTEQTGISLSRPQTLRSSHVVAKISKTLYIGFLRWIIRHLSPKYTCAAT